MKEYHIHSEHYILPFDNIMGGGGLCAVGGRYSKYRTIVALDDAFLAF